MSNEAKEHWRDNTNWFRDKQGRLWCSTCDSEVFGGLCECYEAKEHNCGHNLVDWDGDGNCITCARDKIADPLGDMFEAMGVDVIDVTPKEVK